MSKEIIVSFYQNKYYYILSELLLYLS